MSRPRRLMVRHSWSVSHGQWFTFVDSTEEPDRLVASQQILRVLWPTMAWFDMDLAGLRDDVLVKALVEKLLPHRTRQRLRRRPSDIVHLTPGCDDAALEAAMQLLTRTVGSTGFAAADSNIVYDVNDAGSSCAFRLTAAQFIDIEARLQRRGLAPTVLVPLRQTG